MKALTLSTTVEPKRYIGVEEIQVLNDIKGRCFFDSAKERNQFVRTVCATVGASDFPSILEDDFETAYNTAMTILRNRGEEILRGCLPRRIRPVLTISED